MKKYFLRNVLCIVMSVAMVLSEANIVRASEESASGVSETYLQDTEEMQIVPEQEERAKGQIVPEPEGSPEEQTVLGQEEMLESVISSDSEAVVEASGIMAKEHTDKMLSTQEEYGAWSLVDEAVAIQLDRNYTGNITTSSARCVYKITLSQSGTLNINSRSADANKLYYVLYDVDEKRIAYTDTKYNYATGLNSADINWVLASGTYYLIFGTDYDYYDEDTGVFYTGTAGSFNFRLSLDATGESFPEGNGGSNNSLTTASNISLGQAYIAQLAENDDEDYFKFTLANPSLLTLSVTSATSNIDYEFYGLDGKRILGDYIWQGGMDSYHLTKGTYYLRFSKYGYKPGDTSIYKFSLAAKAVSETFPDIDGGSNNTLMTANKISLGKSYSGQIAENDSVDYFQFTISATQKMNLKVSGEREFDYTIYDFNGNEKWRRYGSDQTFTTELQKGTYYLGVCEYNTGTYSFQLSAYQPDSAQISNIENTAKGVKLTWNSVSGATGYKIYRRQGKGSYKLIKTVKKGTTTSYTDKKASNKKQYTYKLKTIENSYSSVYSTTKTIYCMKTKAAVKKLSKTTGGFTVSLKKVSGATGYEIQYSSNKTFSYSVYNKTTKKRTLKISVYSSPYYKYTYYVRVRAYKKVGKKKYYAPWGARKKVTI